MAHADTTSGGGGLRSLQHNILMHTRRRASSGLAALPCFVAPPAAVDFHLRSDGNTPMADLTTLDHWRPGWALAAVGGRGVDVVDVDPRNGGTEWAERAAGGWLVAALARTGRDLLGWYS